ncbi:MAG: DUF2378 family protein [Myxococcales bacterium]|nr:DUF2378 family protein [Myxococcales bacterium]
MTFRAPDWNAPLDPGIYIDRASPVATAKGMFFVMVQRELRKVGKLEGVAAAAPTYRAFKDYPYVDLLKLEVAASEALFPGESLREGLRRLGHCVFPMFLEHMIGRVLFGVVGRDPQQLLRLAAKGYAVAASHGTAEALEVNGTSGVLRLKNVCNFPTAFHVGVVEGTLKHLELRREVEYDERALFDVDIRASWR